MLDRIRDNLTAIVSFIFLVHPLAMAAETRHAGTAVVIVDASEYTIPIECKDPADASKGFSTEPARITRENTGRTSGIRLTVRPWKETEELVVSLDRYMAWLPKSTFSGTPVEATVDLSTASVMRDGVPAAMTYDDWKAGNRPEGLTGVKIRVDCSMRDPEAPSSRNLAQ